MAVLSSTMMARTDRLGIISGDKGHLIVENINNPQRVTVVDNAYQVKSVYDCPRQITGYEYEIYACAEALRCGWLEAPAMPHEETLRVMRMMDEFACGLGAYAIHLRSKAVDSLYFRLFSVEASPFSRI